MRLQKGKLENDMVCEPEMAYQRDASAEIKGCFWVKREEYSRLKEEHVQRSSGRRETDT